MSLHETRRPLEPKLRKRITPAEAVALLTPRRGRIRNVAPVEDRTYSGRVYHSKAEAKYAFELDMLKVAGKIKGWEPQIPVPIVVNGHKICSLIIDFRVQELDGTFTYYELKGWVSEIWRLKRKLLAACHGNLKYVVVRV